MENDEYMPNLAELSALLSDARKIIVGVSGGIDSMVLLDVMHKNRHIHGRDFTVLHVNHNINPNCHEWAEFVKNYCDERNIKCVVESVSIKDYCSNVENAARQARYQAFAKQKADHIVLAHHANDQCETFFLKLLRGSGLKGLRCMSKSTPSWFDPDVKLVRPFLDTSKDWILGYAKANSVTNIEDLSNNDVRFDRNWIRNRLWPTIVERSEIADVNILKSVSLISEAWELTQDLAKIDYDKCVNLDNTLDWYKLKNLSHARLKNVVLYLLDQNNVTGFSTHYIEDFTRALLNSDMDSRSELRVKNFKMRKIGKRILYGAE
jgi:tRNA(Ile)-lysidine synthase